MEDLIEKKKKNCERDGNCYHHASVVCSSNVLPVGRHEKKMRTPPHMSYVMCILMSTQTVCIFYSHAIYILL